MSCGHEAASGMYFDEFHSKRLTRQLPTAPSSQPRRRSRRRLPSVPGIATTRGNDEMQAAIRERVNASLRLSQMQAQAHHDRLLIEGATAASPEPSRRCSAQRGSLVTLHSKPGSPNTRLRSLGTRREPFPMVLGVEMSKCHPDSLDTRLLATRHSNLAKPSRSSKARRERDPAPSRTELPRFWHPGIGSHNLRLDNTMRDCLPQEGAHMKPLFTGPDGHPQSFDQQLQARLHMLHQRQQATIATESWGWHRKLAKDALQSRSHAHVAIKPSRTYVRATSSAPIRRPSKMLASKRPSHHSLRERLLMQNPRPHTHDDIHVAARSSSPTVVPSPPRNFSPTSSRLGSPKPGSTAPPPTSAELEKAVDTLDWLQDPKFKWDLSPKHSALAHLL